MFSNISYICEKTSIKSSPILHLLVPIIYSNKHFPIQYVVSVGSDFHRRRTRKPQAKKIISKTLRKKQESCKERKTKTKDYSTTLNIPFFSHRLANLGNLKSFIYPIGIFICSCVFMETFQGKYDIVVLVYMIFMIVIG